ncbi:MAG: MBL fold metallo-hydrolase [Alphaproteobacteria bacterium]|nr:MBL fold metallo-hydrolase [Alphaproteobacteria bacterium]
MTEQATAVARPRIARLADGIFQILGQKPSCHVYLIRGTGKNVLIDAGLPTAIDHLDSCLAELGISRDDLHLVLLTHEHIDHVGAAPLLFGRTVIAAHRLAANKIALKDEFAMMSKAFSAAVEGFRVDMWLDGDITVHLGDYRLRVLHTPGHSSGCVCFHEPDHGLLFSGDTLMAGGVMGGIFGSGNISDYINSLELLKTLRLNAVYPGHGRVSTTPAEDIAKALSRSRELLDETKILFDAMNSTRHFEQLLRSTRDLNA